MFTPERIYEEELLDSGAGTDEDVAQNLADLRRINRFLGGTRVILKSVSKIISDGEQDELSLLDVGTGSADIPMAVARWCRLRGIDPVIAAVDLSERNLLISRTVLGIDSQTSLVRADALALPFEARSFDLVTASLFLHHFVEDDVVRLLTEFVRVAKRAVIINDLVRSLIPYYLIRMAGPVFATSFLTRNDGPVSVLRGFTAAELSLLAERARLPRYKVEHLFPYRLSLVSLVGH
jgi:ubiquinone/menaquinone biosynthesis C-methylase UbiE